MPKFLFPLLLGISLCFLACGDVPEEDVGQTRAQTAVEELTYAEDANLDTRAVPLAWCLEWEVVCLDDEYCPDQNFCDPCMRTERRCVKWGLTGR